MRSKRRNYQPDSSLKNRRMYDFWRTLLIKDMICRGKDEDEIVTYFAVAYNKYFRESATRYHVKRIKRELWDAEEKRKTSQRENEVHTDTSKV